MQQPKAAVKFFLNYLFSCLGSFISTTVRRVVNTNFLKSGSDYTDRKDRPDLNLRVYNKKIKTNQQHLCFQAIYALHSKQTFTTSTKKQLYNESPSLKNLWFLAELFLQKPPIFFSIHPYSTPVLAKTEAELYRISSPSKIFQMSNKDQEQLELQQRIASSPVAINRTDQAEEKAQFSI